MPKRDLRGIMHPHRPSLPMPEPLIYFDELDPYELRPELSLGEWAAIMQLVDSTER